MTLSPNINDLEKAKFEEVSGQTAVRVTGSSLSGNFSPSGVTVGGRVTEVEIVSTEWRPLPPTPLSGRNAILIQNVSGEEMKLNYDLDGPLNPGVGYVGTKVIADGEAFRDIKDTILIYGRSKTGTQTIVVEEVA